MGLNRWKFTREFKEAAVRRLERWNCGSSARKRSLDQAGVGLTKTALRRWSGRGVSRQSRSIFTGMLASGFLGFLALLGNPGTTGEADDGLRRRAGSARLACSGCFFTFQSMQFVCPTYAIPKYGWPSDAGTRQAQGSGVKQDRLHLRCNSRKRALKMTQRVQFCKSR